MSTSNVWGCLPSVPTTSLSEVMSEQLAGTLAEEEKIMNHGYTDDHVKPDVAIDPDCDNDLLIARTLQLQFDKEYDEYLSKTEKHHNKDSKVSVSYSKYKATPPSDQNADDDSEDEFDEDIMDQGDWDCYETSDREISAQMLPKCGYRKIGDSIMTKHDTKMTQRSNGKRVMEFPPEIQTGDGGGFEMQLSNSVYNGIRNFSIKEGKRRNRIHDKEDKATDGEHMDPKTRLILYKLVNNGVLDAINGIISTGKEAVIMHAEGGGTPDMPKECAIKIFKTTLNEFKCREKYIRDDYRFRDRFAKSNVVNMWAEKEMHNLMKMAEFGIRVPEVILLKKHVLGMSFVGCDGVAAPKLRDAVMSGSEYAQAYEDVIDTVKVLFSECKLVHADLSEYNILWHLKKCWYIDVGQAVEPDHPHGLEFLYRDLVNISRFFGSKIEVKSPAELFTQVTGLKLDENENVDHQLAEHQRLFGEEDFEFAWDKSKSIPTPISKKSSSSKSPKSRAGTIKSLASMTEEELQDYKETVVG